MKRKKVYVIPEMVNFSLSVESALLAGSFNGGHSAGSDAENIGGWEGGHDEGGGGAGSGWVAPDDGD